MSTRKDRRSTLEGELAAIMAMASAPLAASSPGDEPRPFRFMDFPPEIRNKVYAHLLCPEPDFQPDEDGHYVWSDIAPLYATAILLTSRQVYGEARDVLLRENQFVRVFVRGVVLTLTLALVPVHVVTHSHFPQHDRVVRAFRGSVMSYLLKDELTFRDHGSEPSHTCDLLLRARDLDAFVRGVADPQTGSGRMATGTRHRITIHDPFRKAKDPRYMNVASQKRLLQPFRDHFHGFTQFSVDGEVRPSLAAAVVREARHEALPDPDAFIESIRQAKDEGNAFFRAGNTARATVQWSGALAKIQRLRSSTIWSRIEAELGPDFLDALTEMFFVLNSNKVQAMLAQMRECDGDDFDMLFFELEKIKLASSMSNAAAEVLGSMWTPTARQQAKLFFRCAQAARLGGDYPYAHDFIGRAIELLPDDREIRQEADEITRMGLMIMTDLGIISGMGL